ncbi:MAG: DHA2 family efflux MFS transporter permease subunit, partial [Spirochaetia bacterium]|nr:DHA2 family efflux MFS transporter permease subunit [Spirochaetia bacterium]
MKKQITIMKIGVFLGLLAETYLNAALPQLMQVFDATADQAQWLTSAYMLTMGISVPISAFLIKRMTAKQLYSAALVLFLLGSLVCSLSMYLQLLLFGRVLQAIGASVMLPLMMHSIMVSYEPNERGRAMGSAMLVVLFAPALGPTFGGLVLQLASWQWIFLATIPVIVIGLLCAFKGMPNAERKEVVHLDLLSAVLSLVGFFCFVYGMEQLFSHVDTRFYSMLIVGVGILSLILLVLRQNRLTEPMLDVRLFRMKAYTIGMVLITLTHMTMFANFILLPMFLVKLLGFSAFQAGLLVLPGGLVGAVIPRFAGRLYDRIGPVNIVGGGFFLLTIMNFFMANLTLETSALQLMLGYMFLMCGVGCILTPTQTHSLNQLGRSELAHGTAIMNTLMLIGASMGASFFVGFMASKAQELSLAGLSSTSALLGGIRHAYQFATAFALLGLGLSMQLKR